MNQLPERTLGYAFWQNYTQNHFPFPGQAGGIPERLVFQDLGHLLSGYDTTPVGEIQQGAFPAILSMERVYWVSAICQFVNHCKNPFVKGFQRPRFLK